MVPNYKPRKKDSYSSWVPVWKFVLTPLRTFAVQISQGRAPRKRKFFWSYDPCLNVCLESLRNLFVQSCISTESFQKIRPCKMASFSRKSESLSVKVEPWGVALRTRDRPVLLVGSVAAVEAYVIPRREIPLAPCHHPTVPFSCSVKWIFSSLIGKACLFALFWFNWHSNYNVCNRVLVWDFPSSQFSGLHSLEPLSKSPFYLYWCKYF